MSKAEKYKKRKLTHSTVRNQIFEKDSIRELEKLLMHTLVLYSSIKSITIQSITAFLLTSSRYLQINCWQIANLNVFRGMIETLKEYFYYFLTYIIMKRFGNILGYIDYTHSNTVTYTYIF